MHISADGRILHKYDPAKSFIPLGVWCMWTNRLDVIASGGFNTLVLAGYERTALNDAAEREKMLKRFRSAGLKLVPGGAIKDEGVRGIAGDPTILAYFLIDEPNRFLGDKEEPIQQVYKDVIDAQRRVWELDPGRATWVNLVPSSAFQEDIAQLGWWYAFNAIGEIGSTDCYPVIGPESIQAGVAESVAEQVRINEDRRATFFIAQGHKDKRPPGMPENVYPTPEQFRCSIYTAVVHGAVGFFVFKLQEDEWKAHPGIGPDTVASTGTPEELAKQERETNIITAADAQRSRDLWSTAKQINAEITSLKQVILTPTADIDYHIALLDSKDGSGVEIPVRSLLKNVNDWFYLFAVNVDKGECKVRFDLPRDLGEIRDLSLVRNEGPKPAAEQASIEDTLGPFGVRIYKFRMRR